MQGSMAISRHHLMPGLGHDVFPTLNFILSNLATVNQVGRQIAGRLKYLNHLIYFAGKFLTII